MCKMSENDNCDTFAKIYNKKKEKRKTMVHISDVKKFCLFLNESLTIID